MITYLQRLREQGWDVTRTERKLLMCGGEVAKAILSEFLQGTAMLHHRLRFLVAPGGILPVDKMLLL